MGNERHTPSALAHHEKLTPKYLGLLVLMVAILLIYATLAAIRAVEFHDATDFQYSYWAAHGVFHGEHLYKNVPEHTGVWWYAYFPLQATLLTPLVPLGVGGAGAVWAFINAGLIALCVYVSVRECVSRLGMKLSPNLVVGVALPVVLVFADKFRGELRLGQSDAFVMIWMLMGLYWLSKRPILAGIMLGGSVNVKLQGMVFLPYLIVRGRWKTLIGFVLGTLGFMFGGSLIWGWERNQEYLSTVFGWALGIARIEGIETVAESGLYPLEWIRSLSIPSVMARAELAWGLPEGFVPIATIGFIALMFVIGWTLYLKRGASLFRGRSGKTDDADPSKRGLVCFEWAGLMVGVLIFSPQSTVRHFFLSVFVVALASAVLHTTVSWRKKTPILALMVLYGVAMSFPPPSMGSALELTRGVGLVTWVLVALYFTTLWTGLGIVRELRESPDPAS